MKTKERNRYLKKRLEPFQPSTSSKIGGRVFPGLPRMGEAEGLFTRVMGAILEGNTSMIGFLSPTGRIQIVL